MLASLVTWVTLFAFYLLFAGQASGAELCAGALAAGVGAGLQAYLRARGERPVAIDAPWGRLAGRVAASLARDTAAVAGALVRVSVGRAVHGLTQRQDFLVGGPSQMAAGRRAVVILAASVAPNGFVEQLVPGDQALVVHRLVPAAQKEDHRWPI